MGDYSLLIALALGGIMTIVIVIVLEVNRKATHKHMIENVEREISTASVVYDLQGSNGRLIVCEDSITIIKDSVPGDYGNSLAVNKTIPMTSIKYVRFQDGNVMPGGFIQFGISEERSAKKGIYGRFYDENTILLAAGKQSDVGREVKKYIEKCISEKPEVKATVIQQTSAADEILKLKQLLDMGAITQEEYDAKKKQLLGL